MNFASQATHQKFPFPYEAVFAGLLKVIPETGLTLKDADKLLGRITASTGMSLFSWGENVVIIVEKIDDNTSIVAIESALKLGSNIAGAHRHQKNFNQIISALSKLLQLQTAAERETQEEAVDMLWLSQEFDGLGRRLLSLKSAGIDEIRAACTDATATLGQIQAKLDRIR